ncbi:MAG: rod-binding protein [Hyphomicrobiaceae bacterium]|nr:rod-binding protein [Hyphomicrobiaceae bacterium]
MGITPKTDLLLGVSLAADPLKYQEAVTRLRDISPDASFASLLADRGGSGSDASAGKSDASGPEDALSSGPVVKQPTMPRVTEPKSQIADVYNKLEAFIMQTFIQSMLPKDASSVYGKGTAGDVWKSMLAEKMGNEVAKSGQIGIAKRLAQASITTGSIARFPPAANLVPMSATLPSLSGKSVPSTAGFSRALTALQETAQVEKPAVKTLQAWTTTVKVERSS